MRLCTAYSPARSLSNLLCMIAPRLVRRRFPGPLAIRRCRSRELFVSRFRYYSVLRLLELIGPTRCEDRSIGSSRRKWRKIAPRRTLKRHRLAKRHQIGPGGREFANPSGGVMATRRNANGAGEASVPPAPSASARETARAGRTTILASCETHPISTSARSVAAHLCSSGAPS